MLFVSLLLVVVVVAAAAVVVVVVVVVLSAGLALGAVTAMSPRPSRQI